MKRAVFLDRDGVVNKLVLNPATGEYESPHHECDLELCPGVLPALKKLQQAGYLLFVVSNQPSYAKGKTTLENIQAVHARLAKLLEADGIHFSEYYYCYHHPKGVVPEYSGPCACRKPEPYFLRIAEKQYGLDMKASWMVGDRDTDIRCGQAAGVRTILVVTEEQVKGKQGKSVPDHTAAGLPDAAEIIIREEEHR